MSELYLDILNGFKEIAQMQGKSELESHIDELASSSSIEVTESLDQMREKALKMKEDSNAFAILYGYRVKDKEVELEPEEFSTEEEYKDRVKQITNSFTKLSDKDPRGNRYGKEHNITFYTIYPNKKQNVNESILTESGWAENHYMLSPARQKKLEAIRDAGMWEDFEDAVYDASDIITGIHIEELEIQNNAAKTDPPYITDQDITQAKKLFYKLCDQWYNKINNKNETLDRELNQKITEQANNFTEQQSKLKWNIGSDKSKLTAEEMDLLEQLAKKLEVNSPNGYKYITKFTYEDFGSGMQWYTVVCYDKKGNSWQVLNTKEWLDLMNTSDIDAVYNEIVNSKYFQDKEIYSPFKTLDSLDD